MRAAVRPRAQVFHSMESVCASCTMRYDLNPCASVSLECSIGQWCSFSSSKIRGGSVVLAAKSVNRRRRQGDSGPLPLRPARVGAVRKSLYRSVAGKYGLGPLSRCFPVEVRFLLGSPTKTPANRGFLAVSASFYRSFSCCKTLRADTREINDLPISPKHSTQHESNTAFPASFTLRAVSPWTARVRP